MSYDTRSDPYLLLLDLISKILEETSKQSPRKYSKLIAEESRKLNGVVKTLRFSYLPPGEMSSQGLLEPIKRIAETLNPLVGDKEFERYPLALANLRFAVRYMRDPEDRIGRRGSIASPLDAVWVEVLNAKKLGGNLLGTKVGGGGERFDVATNMSVKRGDFMLLCLLPPKKFGSFVSEGMFVDGPVKEKRSGLVRLSGRPLRNAEAALREFLREMNVS